MGSNCRQRSLAGAQQTFARGWCQMAAAQPGLCHVRRLCQGESADGARRSFEQMGKIRLGAGRG